MGKSILIAVPGKVFRGFLIQAGEASENTRVRNGKAHKEDCEKYRGDGGRGAGKIDRCSKNPEKTLYLRAYLTC